jgi:hypothetical protein
MKNPEIEYPEIKTMTPVEIFIKVAYLRLNDKNVPVFIGKVIKRKDMDAFAKELKQTYNSPSVEFVTIDK